MEVSEQKSQDEQPPYADEEASIWPGLLYGGALAVGVAFWLRLVTVVVDDIYLDEEFHVRQALVYFSNQFSVWDPKITTPPGLYLVAYPWLHFLRLIHAPGSLETHLRLLNAVSLIGVFWTVRSLAITIRKEREPKKEKEDVKQPELQTDFATDPDGGSTTLIGLNAALFPPLFFFSALFYTDILSALVVLRAHLAFYRRQSLWVLFWSITSLAFRQTNVFWTGLYLAGLEVRGQLLNLHNARHGRAKGVATRNSWTDVISLSWKEGLLYDSEAAEAAVEDYFKSGISLALAAVGNVQHLLLPLLPHLTTIVSFCAFVVWNGGVVLGDKSNHVATLHLPQMLYIWPCFVFFSYPLLLSDILTAVLTAVWPFVPASFKPADLEFKPTANVPRPLVIICFIALTLAIVHFNTIVHPFILADNRHFTFYVFRLLMRHPAIKYLAAPIYIACGWGCLTAGAAEQTMRKEQRRPGPSISSVLIWLIVTTTSLVTAPLVEPRYFIVPWLFWMINSSSSKGTLDLHMNWSIMVNLAVAYVFLFWGFEWPRQPGQVMRFMW